MTKNTEVAVAKKTAVAMVDSSSFEAFAGEGLESITSSDLAIPYLRILAALSPQVNKRDGKYVEGAEAGMIYNTVENTAYSGEDGVLVIPCYYRRVYVEWKPREKGGGVVGSYPSDHPIIGKTYRDDRGNDVLENGNLLVNTAEFYVLMIDSEGNAKRCLVTMTATQLKKARKWLTQMSTITGRRKDGSIFTMPMMANVYTLRTVEERNDKGSWFGWEVSKENLLNLQDPDDAAMFQMAVEFGKSVKAGEVKVKEEDTHSSNAADDEGAPF